MRFYKETVSEHYWNWYVDIPDWEGNKGDLLMVMGADTLLDDIQRYQNREDEVITFITAGDVLDRTDIVLEKVKEHAHDEYGSGATYNVISYNSDIELGYEIWLCDVVLTIFGEFPETIYLKIK